MKHLLQLFARCSREEYKYYADLRRKCGVVERPVYFSSTLAQLFFK